MFRIILSAIKRKIPKNLLYYSKAFVFELEKDNWEGNPLCFNYPQDYCSRFVKKNELKLVSQLGDTNINHNLFRFEFGDKCFCVFKENKPVNINWIHNGPCYIRGYGYDYSACMNNAYIYWIITKTSERGKGLYWNSLIELANILFNSGSESITQLVEYNNYIVLKTLSKLNYTKIKIIRHLRIFYLKFTSVHDLKNNQKSRRFFINHKSKSLII